MSATTIDGLATSKIIKQELAQRVSSLKERGVEPGLATVLVGDDPASHAYVGGKRKDCAEVGIRSIGVDLPATASQADVLAAVEKLNADPACHGYIVQLPLPKGLDEIEVLEAIDPAKDADGLHPTNLGRLVTRVNTELDSPAPCTPRGVIELLHRYDIPTAGASIAVLGRSVLVGRSISMLLSRRAENATVTMCHTGTKNVTDITQSADIVVAAVGVPGMVTKDYIAPGATVIDVGINRVDDPSAPRGYRLVGDVAGDVADIAGAITPVPGGVGPMTRAMLLANVVESAERALAAAGE